MVENNEWEIERAALKGALKRAKQAKSTAQADRAAAAQLMETMRGEMERLRGEIANLRFELEQERRKNMAPAAQLELQRLLDAWDAASDPVRSTFRERISGGNVIPLNRLPSATG